MIDQEKERAAFEQWAIKAGMEIERFALDVGDWRKGDYISHDTEYALKAWLACAQSAPQWIACSERMPPNSGRVLVIGEMMDWPATARFLGAKYGGWIASPPVEPNHGHVLSPEITHWMPLPPPPGATP